MRIEVVFLGISIFFFLILLVHFLYIFIIIRPKQIKEQFGENAMVELNRVWVDYKNSEVGKYTLLAGGCSTILAFGFLCASIAIFIIRFLFG